VFLNNREGNDCCRQLGFLFDSFPDLMNGFVLGGNEMFEGATKTCLEYCSWTEKLSVFKFILEKAKREVVLEVLSYQNVCSFGQQYFSQFSLVCLVPNIRDELLFGKQREEKELFGIVEGLWISNREAKLKVELVGSIANHKMLG